MGDAQYPAAWQEVPSPNLGKGGIVIEAVRCQDPSGGSCPTHFGSNDLLQAAITPAVMPSPRCSSSDAPL